MEDLSLWYNGLQGMEKVFWICAAVSSLIFIIQFILTFIGVDSTDADFDFDSSPGDTIDTGGFLSLFSVRNIVNFFVGFGWGGVSLGGYISNKLLLVIVAMLIGLLFVVVFFFLVKQLMKLEADGTVKMEDCVGKNCEVYLRIPAANGGKGKVQISINGTVLEFDAVTDEAEVIPTGARVFVVKHLGGGLLLVNRL